jgi:hypothetical protein
MTHVIGGLVVIRAGETPPCHVTFIVADRDDSATNVERLAAKVVSSSDSQFAPPDGNC